MKEQFCETRRYDFEAFEAFYEKYCQPCEQASGS